MIRAFFKLSIKDRIVLAISAIAFIVAVFTIIFRLMNGSLIGFASFPRSILQDDPKYQKYNQYDYKYFPTSIQFPGTEYGLHVGGQEIPPTEMGAGFKFTDSITITASVIGEADETPDFIAQHFPQIMSGDMSTRAGQYRSKVHDDGYLNTLFIEYEGGVLTTGEGKNYVLTYRVSVAQNKFLLGLSTTDRSELKECFYLLNHMLCTIFKYGKTADSSVDVSGNKVVLSDDGTIDVSAPTIELMGEERDYENLADVEEDIERSQYKLKYPDASVIEETLSIGSSLESESVAFAFEYTYGSVTPESAELISPQGESISPDYFNDEKDGRIVFIVERPSAGDWKIVVSDDIEMGSYGVHAMRYMDYMDAIKGNAEEEYDPEDESVSPIRVERTAEDDEEEEPSVAEEGPIYE